MDEVKLLPCVTRASLQFADGSTVAIDFATRTSIDEALSKLRLASTGEARAIEATRPTEQDLGAIPGSHPTDQAPSGLGASRFDPERWRISRYDAISSQIIDERGFVRGLILSLTNGRWFVEIDGVRQGHWTERAPLAAFNRWRELASAIEARRAATENTGAVHESAVPQGDAHE